MDANESKRQFAKALALHKAGRSDEALPIVKELEVRWPGQTQLIYLRALCLTELGRLDESLTACGRIKEAFDDNRVAELTARIQTMVEGIEPSVGASAYDSNREPPRDENEEQEKEGNKRGKWLGAALLLLLFGMAALPGILKKPNDPPAPLDERIKAFNIDFNWGAGGPNDFAAPGLFAKASPARHVAWYKNLGANTLQTFCVSQCGYAWYDSKIAPVQPGMEGDFLTEVARLAHAEGMRVMGYFCVGANTHWGQTRPELSYGTPNNIHIPLTTEYLDYLCACIEEALTQTGIDGFMLDLFFSPPLLGKGATVRWLACEKKMYAELFDEPFPGAETITPEKTLKFQRRAVARAWTRIRKTSKAAKPDCILWLSCIDLEHPQMQGQRMFREIDWIMNESPTPEKLDMVLDRIGPHTKVIQCVVGASTSYDASRVIDNPKYADMGLFGFAPWPDETTTLPPTNPQGKRQVNIARNIEKVRRAFRGVNPAGKQTPQ